jgi:hypothetical protein
MTESRPVRMAKARAAVQAVAESLISAADPAEVAVDRAEYAAVLMGDLDGGGIAFVLRDTLPGSPKSRAIALVRAQMAGEPCRVTESFTGFRSFK